MKNIFKAINKANTKIKQIFYCGLLNLFEGEEKWKLEKENSTHFKPLNIQNKDRSSGGLKHIQSNSDKKEKTKCRKERHTNSQRTLMA